ncbi:hypothetical protein DS745_20310 [Anaerobacillus alkaliphilus]|uniref:Uncharacterized protein n=1 Tax=Anaerobacillus alkaliphilus TaxID=1548597 RepID=A0A4Q0VT96_9BACI|nr:hypothetical protein [Anaerobacillus alkaliphilus]RXI98660.1 hypothetical protein DS745_20310 [Anaerobacillus alkaliphilus]
MKPLRTPMTTIGNLKITNVSGGASLNFGPAIHKGHQANMKIETGEYIIGDEFNFGCPPEEEENNDNDDNGNGNDEMENDDENYFSDNEDEDEDEELEYDNKKPTNGKRWKWVDGNLKRADQIEEDDD